LVSAYYLLYKKRDFKTLVPVVLFALFWLYDYPSNSPAFREGVKILLISVPMYTILLFWVLLAFLLLRERYGTQEQLV
jgi:hypothetical protein